MKIKLLIIILFATVLGCNTNKDKEPVLIIGKYKLTKTDLEFKRKKDRYNSLTDQALADKLIEEGRMIAFALDHRYDTLATLKKLFEYASRSYASQVDGFVWNKTVKPKLQLTENDIKNTYLKRSQEHVLEVVLVSDKSVLDRYYKSADDLNVIRAKGSSDPRVKVFNATVKFPYYPLINYIADLDNLKVGQIIGPIETERGYLIARVAATKPVVQNPYEQEKARIRQELLFGLTQKYQWENQKRIFKDANPEIYDAAVSELALKFDTRKKDWPGVKPNLLIMNYNFGGKRVSYMVSDLREFVTNEPVFFGSLNTPDGVKKILHNIIIEQYLFAEARQMNMDADDEYLQFHKDNQENILLEHYKRNYVYPRLSVYPNELQEYYRKNSGNFKTFQSASISLFKFKNIQNAFQGRMQLEKKARGISLSAGNSNTAKTIALPGAIEMEVKMNDQNNDPKLLEAVLRLAPGQISSPVEVNGEFVVIILTAKKGLTTMPYIYVKDELQRIIYAQKEKRLTAQLAEDLKEKYPLGEDELKEYLSEIKGNSQ